MKFRKKPIVIEAFEVNAALRLAESGWKELPDWLRAAYEGGKILFLADSVDIDTLEGTMKGARGDWIIRGVKGELYPCKPDVFLASYEAA
jgi:hypothetical protein